MVLQVPKRSDAEFARIRQFNRLLGAILFAFDLKRVFAGPHHAFSMV